MKEVTEHFSEKCSGKKGETQKLLEADNEGHCEKPPLLTCILLSCCC